MHTELSMRNTYKSPQEMHTKEHKTQQEIHIKQHKTLQEICRYTTAQTATT